MQLNPMTIDVSLIKEYFGNEVGQIWKIKGK